MTSSKLATWLVALGLLGQVGIASANANASDAEARPAARSEVLADLEVWRDAGMEAIASIDQPPGVDEAHRRAHARYLALRSSVEFNRIVARIAREIGEVTDFAGVRR